MQQVLAEHAHDLPRSILLFVGNVRAAEANLLDLPDQVDYNRCWPGSNLEPNATSQMMQRVVEIAHAITPVCRDRYSQHGQEPALRPYCRPQPAKPEPGGTRFNRVAMVFKHKGVCSMAFDQYLPGGYAGMRLARDPEGIEHARRFVEGMLTLDELPGTKPTRHALHLVESHLTLNIPSTSVSSLIRMPMPIYVSKTISKITTLP